MSKLDENYSIELFTNKKSKTDAQVSKTVLEMAIAALEKLDDWTLESVHDCLLSLAAEKGLKNGTMLWPVRIAMAGKQVTPGGAIEIAILLGRDEAMRRLNLGLAKLSE